MYSTLYSLIAIAAAAPGCFIPPSSIETSAGATSTSTSAETSETSQGSFGLITIHSGSDVQYQSVKLSSDGHLSLNGETDATFVLNDDTSLYVNGQGLELFEGYPIVPPSGTHGITWGVENQHLTFNGVDGFVACLDNNRNIAFSGEGGAPSTCQNPIGVALRVVEL